MCLWWNDNLSRSGCCHQIEIATTDTNNAYMCHYLTCISKSIRKCCTFVFKRRLPKTCKLQTEQGNIPSYVNVAFLKISFFSLQSAFVPLLSSEEGQIITINSKAVTLPQSPSCLGRIPVIATFSRASAHDTLPQTHQHFQTTSEGQM